MLDKIQNSSSELITQSHSLDRIWLEGTQSPIERDKNYFVDQSEISSLAFEKYQREEDIKTFSNILMETDEKEANSLVVSKALDGNLELFKDDILNELLGNSDFINDVTQEIN